MYPRSDYEVVLSTSSAIWLADRDGPVSITNDAERVTAECILAHGENRRIIYTDTQGECTELLHDGEMFIGFKAAPDMKPLDVIRNPPPFSYRPPLEKICKVCHEKYVGFSCPSHACHAREPV